MADSTLSSLQARFPRLAWRAEADHHVATRSASAVEAVEKLATEVQLSAALSGLPAEPEEREAPNMPGPAGLGCPALAAVVGLVGAFGAALWLGVEAVRWLTGGAS